MTSNHDKDESNEDIVFDSSALPDDIADLLANEATWEPVPDELQESIVASILTEVDLFDEFGVDSTVVVPAAPSLADTSLPTNDLVVVRPARWRAAALGAAAAVLAVAGLFGIARLTAEGPDFEVALAATDLAPAASAIAEITDTPEGTRIVISVKNLPPAEPGTYYQAWLRKDAEVGVSAGTFHLRSGDDAIELWAGVSTDDYPLLTVTLQQEAQTESSGQVVLKTLIVSEP